MSTEKKSLTGKIWHKKADFDESQSLLSNYLSAQKKTKEDIIPAKFSDFISPFEFSDMEKSIELIKKSIEKNERILIFGDYDADGMTGTAQLFLTLKSIGAQVSYRLPCRADGYGLSEKFIREAHEKNVKTFITTDCGVSNIEEISLAKELGMQVIITDHHSVPEKIPPADSILHPLIEGEKFSDKDLTGAGVAWFFCWGIFQKFFGEEKAKFLALELLEIALIGTIADCGPLRGENRKIVQLGLEKIKTSKNSGLLELIKSSGSDKNKMTAETIAFFLGPRLNASGRLSHPKISLELLLGDVSKVPILESLNKKRQEMVEDFLIEAEAQVQNQKDSPCLIVSSDEWPAGVIGLISGRLAEEYARPVIAFEVGEEKFVGSCRGPIDFHIANALKEIKAENPEIFLGCGGHAQAAGLSIYPEFFEKFKKKYQEKVQEIRGNIPPVPCVEYLSSIPRSIQTKEVEQLSLAQPFGIGNPFPIFCFENLEVKKIKAVGATKNHLSLYLQSEHGEFFSGIFFRNAHLTREIFVGDFISAIAIPEINEWKDQKNISLKVQDIRKILPQ